MDSRLVHRQSRPATALFSSIGCASLPQSDARVDAGVELRSRSLSNAPVNAFSDIEIHHMGSGLADNVSQGGAGGDQFRTAPLWGLGQRIFLLHDGRTTDLNAAIQAHAGQWQRSHQRRGELRQPQPDPAAGDFGLPAFAVTVYASIPGEARRCLARFSRRAARAGTPAPTFGEIGIRGKTCVPILLFLNRCLSLSLRRVPASGDRTRPKTVAIFRTTCSR